MAAVHGFARNHLRPLPTTVRTPTAYYEKVRIILTTGSPGNPTPMLYVFLDGPQGPGAVLEARYDPSHIYGDTRAGLDIYAVSTGPTRTSPASSSCARRPTAAAAAAEGQQLPPLHHHAPLQPAPFGWPAARSACCCFRASRDARYPRSGQ